MSAIEASPPAEASWNFLKMSGRPPSVGNIHAALKIRGGDWVLGRPGKARRWNYRQPENFEVFSTVAGESDVDEQECEYEYEYYETDDAEEGNDDVGYDSYEEEENNGDASYDDQCQNSELITDDGKYFDRVTEDNLSQWNKDKFFRGWGKRPDAANDERSTAQSTRIAKRVSKSRGLIQVDDGGGGDDEEWDNLFTTPIPAANQDNAQAPSKFRQMKFFSSNTDNWEENENQENGNVKEVDIDDDNSSDHLYETPIPNVNVVNSQPSSMKATKSSQANSSHLWFKPTKMTKKIPSGRKQFRRNSSSNASFIANRFYNRGSPRAARSYKGKSLSIDWLYLYSAPIGNVIQTITRNLAGTMLRWLSTLWLLVRSTIDFLWYGPVEGVTTTGIAMREGGLSRLLISRPVTAMSSVAILGLFSLLIFRRLSDLCREDHSAKDKGVRSDDDEHEYDSSVEEELNFLHREFEAANPFSKKRIANLQSQSITKRKQPLSKLRRGDDRPKSRRGQRQFTIKSIQTWWKERPSQQSIAIIEPLHLHNQQQPLRQEISRLQKKLAVSEQERAVLRQDVQHLQDKLQRVQMEARKLNTQHQRFEKEASMTDQIFSRAVQVERRKSNDEFGKVPESINGVLDRERMLMRGKIAGLERGNMNIWGQNDLDIIKSPNKRIFDGVKIVREIDLDQEDDDDRNWKAL